MSHYSDQQASDNASSGTYNFTSSFSASSFSASSSSNGPGENRSASYSEHIAADPSGATVTTSSARDGGIPTVQTTRYDAAGNRRVEGGEGAGEQRRIEDVTDDSSEDNAEEEYAKREGGV
jgi:hypothetical protein